MAVPISPKGKLVVLAALIGLVSFAVHAFVAYLKDPEATDGCLVEHEGCRAAVEGLVGILDCGIELYHCRALGEHRHLPALVKGLRCR